MPLGTTSCVSGAVVDSCSPGAPAPSDATCNAVDDDCHGATDENYVSVPTSCGVGACSRNGTTSCVSGAVVDSCSPGAPAPSDATCRGVDDDCDTMADDGTTASPCHIDSDGDSYGSGSALTRCRDASRMAQGYCPVGYTNVATDCNDANASVRPMATETCNDIDDDCDGMTDELLTVKEMYA